MQNDADRYIVAGKCPAQEEEKMDITYHYNKTGFIAASLQELAPEAGEALTAVVTYQEDSQARGYWSVEVKHFEAPGTAGDTLFTFGERFDRREEDYLPPHIPVVDVFGVIAEAFSEARVRLGYEARGKTLRMFQEVPMSNLPANW